MVSDGDGRAEIITENYADGKNQMAVFSGDGRQLARWTSPHVFYRFSVARAAGDARPSLIVLSDDAEELVFLTMAGTVTRKLAAPWGNRLAWPHGSPMTVAGSDKGFVCLGDSKGGCHHHITDVYGGGGDLVYADSADDNASALLVLRSGGGGAPTSFLVGGRNVIWKYTEKP